MSDSQYVGEQLRSGDIDMIEQVLNEYENQLQKSIEKINATSILHSHSSNQER